MRTFIVDFYKHPIKQPLLSVLIKAEDSDAAMKKMVEYIKDNYDPNFEKNFERTHITLKNPERDDVVVKFVAKYPYHETIWINEVPDTEDVFTISSDMGCYVFA